MTIVSYSIDLTLLVMNESWIVSPHYISDNPTFHWVVANGVSERCSIAQMVIGDSRGHSVWMDGVRAMRSGQLIGI